MWKWNLSVLVAVLLAFVVLGTADRANADEPKCEPDKVAEKYPAVAGKKIKIGADPGTQPFVFRDPNDFEKVTGFDVELADAVFKCAGIEYEYFLGGWSGLVPAVMAGQIDVMWDALYYLPERAKKLDFVSYMQAGIGALTQPGNPKGLKVLGDMCGVSVVVLLGTVEENTVKGQDEKCKAGGKKAIEINVGPDVAAALRLLLNKRVDVMVIDLGLSQGVAKEHPNDVYFAFKHLTGLTQAVAVPNDSDDLLRAIHDGMRVAQANGTQLALFKKYGMDPELQLAAAILKE